MTSVTDMFYGAAHVSIPAAIRGVVGSRADDEGFQGGKRDDDYCCAHLGSAPGVCNVVSTYKKELICCNLEMQRRVEQRDRVLTAISVVDSVLRCSVYYETAETDDDCDCAERKNAN